MTFMAGNAIVLPFDKVCSWCGLSMPLQGGAQARMPG